MPRNAQNWFVSMHASYKVMHATVPVAVQMGTYLHLLCHDKKLACILNFIRLIHTLNLRRCIKLARASSCLFYVCVLACQLCPSLPIPLVFDLLQEMMEMLLMLFFFFFFWKLSKADYRGANGTVR